MGFDVDAVYAGDNMNAAYVKGQGGTMTLEITDVSQKEFGEEGEEKQKKAVLHFKGEEKQLSLNVTNKNVIKEAFGSHTDGWIGKIIQVQVGRTTYKGKPIDCIQVFIPAQKPATAPSSQPTAVLGQAGADRLAAALTAKGLDLLSLKDHLVKSGLALTTMPNNASQWPASLAGHIKLWLDNPQAVPAAAADSDIPF